MIGVEEGDMPAAARASEPAQKLEFDRVLTREESAALAASWPEYRSAFGVALVVARLERPDLEAGITRMLFANGYGTPDSSLLTMIDGLAGLEDFLDGALNIARAASARVALCAEKVVAAC